MNYKIHLAAIRRNPVRWAKLQDSADIRGMLEYMDHAYRNGDEVVDDATYDALRDYYEDELTGMPPLPVSGVSGADVELAVPMPSLKKFRTLPESSQKRFINSRTGFMLSDKEDGISMALTYERGHPVMLTTRGESGLVGKNVSKLLQHLKVPPVIPYKGKFVVRGELTMDLPVFHKYFSDQYRTTRNMGAGLVTRIDNLHNAKKFKVVMYEIQMGKSAHKAFSEQFQTLKDYGFEVVPHMVVDTLDHDTLSMYHDKRKRESNRDIDGIVIAHDAPYKPAKDYPAYAYAYKQNDLGKTVSVKVVDVEWNESRHGKLAPRIIIEPTMVGNVEVSFVTGHNAFFINHGYAQKDEDNPPYSPRPIAKGAIVRIIRSGDVIPYITEVVQGAGKPSVPSIKYSQKKGEYFADAASEEQEIKKLIYFFTTIGTDGVKEGTVRLLYDHGFRTIKAIFALRENDLTSIHGWGSKSIDTILHNLRESLHNLDFVDVAVASGAFGSGIGRSRIDALFEHIPDLMRYVKRPVDKLAEVIKLVPGFNKLSVQVAKNLKNFYHFLQDNDLKVSYKLKTDVPKVGSKMAGKSVLFTSIRDAELANWIVSQGGKIATTVKNSTMLVTKPGAHNNKTEQAESLGIEVISIDEFRKRYKK